MLPNRTLFLVALFLFSTATLSAAIACLALEIPAAGVPLLIVFMLSTFCFVERNCAAWNRKPLKQTTNPILTGGTPQHTIIEVQPPYFAPPKSNNLPPE